MLADFDLVSVSNRNCFHLNFPANQQVTVGNFPDDQQVTVTNFLRPEYQAVLWLDRTVEPNELVTYPVAGWRTVTITMSIESDT